MPETVFLNTSFLDSGLKPDVMAGQLLMFGFDGTKFNSDIRFLIQKLKIGGFILFKRNIESSGQVHDLCMAMQESARSAGLPPLFIAVDQEGGTVARLKSPAFDEYPGVSEIESLDEAERITDEMSEILKNMGFNMNMSPVLDIAFDPETSIMKKRAYSNSPDKVSEFGSTVIRTFQKNGIMAVAKHFPGIGRTTLDSHLTLPVLETERDIMEKNDLVPFRKAIEEDVSGIMLSHVLYNDIDPDWPASLSEKIGVNMLRNKMGFKGLSLTDDLDMKAIRFDIQTCISRILKSSIDITLICSRNPNQENALDEILRLCRNDRNFSESGLKSVNRILMNKNRFVASGRSLF